MSDSIKFAMTTIWACLFICLLIHTRFPQFAATGMNCIECLKGSVIDKLRV